MTIVGTLVGVILIALGWQYLLNRWLVRRAGRDFAQIQQDALVAAGWLAPNRRATRAEADVVLAAHRRQVADEIARAIEAYDGPLTDGPRITCARIARAHGEAGHG